MQTKQVLAHTTRCYQQENSMSIVVAISPSSILLRELEFATHNASGPGDSCAHFQRQVAASQFNSALD